MEAKDYIDIVAIVLSPVFAVSITLVYQSKKQKKDAKRWLFLNLMAHRKKLVRTAQFCDSLNSIDVVFYNNPTVLKAWGVYFENLCLSKEISDSAKTELLFLELLHEMGHILGYKNLKQTDIYKYYVPQGHGDAYHVDEQLRLELLRVLKGTASVSVVEKIDEGKIPKS